MPRWLQIDPLGIVAAITDSARPVAAPAGWVVKDAANYPAGVGAFWTYDAGQDKFTAPAPVRVVAADDFFGRFTDAELEGIEAIAVAATPQGAKMRVALRRFERGGVALDGPRVAAFVAFLQTAGAGNVLTPARAAAVLA